MRSSIFLKTSLAAALLVSLVTTARGQSAAFSGFDAVHQGNWVGTYGADGYVIANGANNAPAYASLSFTGASTWTWLSPTTDPRGLLSSAANGATRISSTYYSGTSFNINLNITSPAQVALYCVDLDGQNRSQVIKILNASNNAVLDTETISNFTGGVWAVWNISGNVIIQVTNNPGSLNAVVSGLFFKSSAAVPKPTVTMNTPAQNPITGPVTLSAVANATSPATLASVQFQVDGTNIGSPVTTGTNSTYSVQWNNPTTGSHSLTAIATDSYGQSTTSTPIQVTASITAPAGPSATFVKFDTTTKGTWAGTYGGDGYIIANGTSSIPSYAAETTTGASTYTWLSPTTDVRALLTGPTASTRIASTFYTNTSYTFDINLTDGLTHQVALYGLDYETNQRTQTITITDPATQNVLSTQTMSQMYNGLWAVWNINGHVTVKVTYTGGLNAVISGVFFGNTGVVVTTPPPTVSLVTPVAGAVSGTVSVTANAVSSVGVASVQYYLDGTALGSSSTSPSFAYSWNTLTASNAVHTLTAVAKDTLGQTGSASAGVSVTVSNPQTAPPAVSITTPTAGSVSGTVNIQATASATSPATMQSVQFTVDGTSLTTISGVGPYAFSWDSTTVSNGSHTISAIATDSLSHTTTANVSVTVSNAQPPAISITSPAAGTVAGTVSIQATASATSPATMKSVQFSVDGTILTTISGTGPYSYSWDSTTVQNGSHTITATATDSLGHTGTTNVVISVQHGTATAAATLVKTDSSTEGSWVGTYGGDGYIIANGNNAAPTYATVIPSASAATWTWNNPSSDPRALYASPSAGSRIASTYYSSSSFSFDVNLTDGKTHQIAIYALDIEPSQRAETISIQDSTSGTTLASVPLSSFYKGVWSVWNVKGHVVIQVIYTGGLNAVVSGLFFGTVPVSAPPPTVSMTAPAAGTVTGTVNLTSTASSTIGIASVQYYLDGTVLGSPVTTGPTYAYAWDSSTASNGTHILTAVATDVQNQTSSPSAGVQVTVSNPVIVLPTVSITNPAAGNVSASVNIQATASAAAPATLTSVVFALDGSTLTSFNTQGPSFSYSWDTTTVSNGSHTITVTATDSNNHSKSTNVVVNVSNVIASPNTAVFVKSDATTQGNWVGVYGADGFIIPNDITNPPADVTVTDTGAIAYNWFASTTDLRAPLANTTGTNRIASTFYSDQTETFDMNFSDADVHQVAVYCLDFDTTTRAQTMQMVNAATNQVLDTETLSNFNGGVYMVWNVTGHVQLQVINTTNLNGVVSGIFFRDLKGIAHPTVSLLAPASNATLTGPVALSANAQSAQGIASVQFQVDGTNIGSALTTSGPVFNSNWASPLVANGSHSLSVIATDNLGLTTTKTIPITVSNGAEPAASATLSYIDLYTSGSWKGVYGQDGEIQASDATNPPFYAVVNLIGTDVWIWHAGNPTTDVPGVQRLVGNTRIGATFENLVPVATFYIDVNFADYKEHEMALYFADWHHNVRVQHVTVADANTNAVLDTETLTNFSLGEHLVWNITGHVIVTVTLDQQLSLSSPSSAICAAIYFQPPSIAARPTVTMTSPAAGAVSGTVTFNTTATSPIGVTSIQYELDGWPIGSPIPAGSPYTMKWDSTTVPNGVHQLNVYAVDSSNHAATSAPVMINVAN